MPPSIPNPNHSRTTSWQWYEDEDHRIEGLTGIRLLPGAHPVSDPRQLEEHPGRLDYLARLLENSDAPERFRDWWNWVCFELDEEGGLIIYLADPTYQPLEAEDLPPPSSPAIKKRSTAESPVGETRRLFD